MLSMRNVSKLYRHADGPVQALDDVSLDVAPGEFVIVRGPSGCGKTTLLLTAGGLLAPDRGQVEIEGLRPYELGPDQRADFRSGTIGFVFQQFHLVPYLSVLDNVLAPSLATGAQDAEDRARQLIEQFGLADRAGHRPAELSTGERQRVALARAMLNRPRVILADEPTGNLDEANGLLVLESLARFAESDGGAVLLVTHDTTVAAAVQRTVHMNQGRLGRA